MKAVVKEKAAPGAKLLDVDVPEPGPRDVLIKVKVAAICGTDIHIMEWTPYAQARIKPPMIFGHECSGEVVKVGNQVTDFAVGDLVAVETHIPDETCFMCKTGLQHICEKMAIIGVHVDGVFAEYAKIPAVCCWKLAKDTDPDLGAILEPWGVGVNGILKGEVNNRSVAVFGCGPIGLMGLGSINAWGASKIFAVEPSETRLSMVPQFAPDAVLLNPAKQDAVKAILDATGGRGVDVAIDISGNAKGIQGAFKVVRRAGRVSLVGLPGAPVELDITADIIYKETRVFGSTGRMMWHTWYEMQNLLDSGKFDPMPVITHRMPLADFAKGIELAQGGKAGKILLYP
ncbi:MAG TPA: alcohol dehydrogenase catalytic domain-containing protein [Dehalococcoidales bacterium]|nr:alcohol dehydrogenase catalytic domain-containing protein [Dehalococcoidales bacterium]